MRKLKCIIICLSVVAIIIGIAAVGIQLYLCSENSRLVFPLKDVKNDGAEYVMVRYGPDAVHVINDTDVLIANKYKVFMIYPLWLENSTGDGYYQVYRDRECIFSCDLLKGRYFDFVLSDEYVTYAADEFYSIFSDTAS